MKKLKKLETKKYDKAYSYDVGKGMKPVVIYRTKGEEDKHIFYIKDTDSCKMRYVAEAIYAMFHQKNKKQIIIKDKEVGILKFYHTDTEWDIFRKLMKIEEHYFFRKSEEN